MSKDHKKYLRPKFWDDPENHFWKEKTSNGEYVPNPRYIQKPYNDFVEQCKKDDKRLMK